MNAVSETGDVMTATVSVSPVPPGHYGFRQVARLEWIKLRTLRSVRWALLVALAGMTGIGIAAGHNTADPRGDVTNNILAGGALGTLVFAVLGVLVMTSEYSSGTIRATLAAIPRRPLVLAAKASVFGVLALVTGELATFAGFLAGAAFVRHGIPHPALSQPTVLRAVALSGAYLGLIGLIGLALGAIVRHGAAAIAALVVLVFVAPLAGLAQTPAGQFLPELIYANSLGATQPQAGFTLSPWAGLGIICAYAIVLLTVGGWLLARRDA
jgi:ABC-2 type transport system permease protein